MHARRLSCLLLGIWLAGSMLMTLLVLDSAQTADRILLDHPPAASLRLKTMPAVDARLMMAYPVRQQMRWWLVEWEDVEVVLALAFFMFLLFATKEGKMVLAYALAIWGLVLVQRFFTVPQMVYLESLMDFVPPGAMSPERHQWMAARAAYAGLEGFKALLGLGLGAYLIVRSRRPGLARD